MDEKPTLEDEGVSIETEESVEIADAEIEAEAQGDELSEEEESKSDEGEATEDQAEQITTEKLAELFGFDDNPFDVNDEGQVVIHTQVDGKPGAANLKDLVRSYQVQGHLDNKNREVAKLKDTLQQEKAQTEKAIKDKTDHLENLAQLAWSELNREYSAINWEELRSYDSTEFLAKRAEFQDRQGAIGKLYQEVADQKQQQQQDFETEQRAKLIEAWESEDKAKEEAEKVEKYMEGLGLNEENFGQIRHHQVVLAFHKAKLYDEMQKKKPETKNLVKKAPKVSRPGQPGKTKSEPKAIEDYFYS